VNKKVSLCIIEYHMEKHAEALRRLARVARMRNGRLAIDWTSRQQKPRWRMVPLDSQFYNRARLRNAAGARPVVPSTSRRLTPAELTRIQNTNPWSLFEPRARVR
jgi:site-specific DNA-cytosine methylase